MKLSFADNATRGNKKFGDRCEDTVECGFPGSICDPRKKSCQCIEDLPVTNHLDKCGKGKLDYFLNTSSDVYVCI